MVDNALDVEMLSERYGTMALRRCRHLLKDKEEALNVSAEPASGQ